MIIIKGNKKQKKIIINSSEQAKTVNNTDIKHHKNVRKKAKIKITHEYTYRLRITVKT